MENYEELVMKNQLGMIDDLEFLLQQDELAEIYMDEVLQKGITPNPENASQWLLEYELNHLYQ